MCGLGEAKSGEGGQEGAREEGERGVVGDDGG